MRYFVTGATGFLGGEVARQLIAAGHQVVAVVRSPAKAAELAALGVTLHEGDVTEKESLRAPMTGADGVFHIAGWYKIGVRDKSPGMAVNVNGTRNTLEMMCELGIAKGVYTSTVAINSDTHGKIVDETYHYTGPHISEYCLFVLRTLVLPAASEAQERDHCERTDWRGGSGCNSLSNIGSIAMTPAGPR